jgi:hypothetical protein
MVVNRVFWDDDSHAGYKSSSSKETESLRHFKSCTYDILNLKRQVILIHVYFMTVYFCDADLSGRAV